MTVRWDNSGNPDTSVVPRDATQIIPFTDNKTYDDIRPVINDTYAEYFGDVTMSVGQTRDLRNQAVTVSFTGLPTNANAGGTFGPTYVEVFQCWGAPGADGKPDPGATSPDPRTCQEGAGGTDFPAGDLPPSRSTKGDRLLVSGSDVGKPSTLPLLSVAGRETPGLEYQTEFSRTTTNEQSLVRSTFGGPVQRAFELHTGAESTFLGCGERADAPSTGRCWIVAVPISTKVATGLQMGESQWASGLTPSFWAQRMQVPLDFAPAAETCPSGKSRVLASGSEVATLAMRSWIPGLCAEAGLSTGYSQLSDDQARRQLAAGAADVIYTSAAASTDALYAPTALAATVIGLTVDYSPPLCNSGRPEDACEGPEDFPDAYPDRAAYEQALAEAGSPIRDIRLSARLVAKLLTQTYGVDGSVSVAEPEIPFAEKAPFLTERSNWSLLTDPDFRALNPQLKYHRAVGSTDALKKLEVETIRSDAAAELWKWITGDAEASAFLNGCADQYGMTINPWYSTRTYEGCEGKAKALEQVAAEQRDATQVPETFNRDSTPNYRALNAAYPQVLYVETPRGKDEAGEITPGTMVDLYPPLPDQSATARAGLRSTHQRGLWCTTFSGGCSPSLWKSTATTKGALGHREVAVITDSASASRYQLTTASLCDSKSSACVSADSPSITRQASRYVVDSPMSIAAAPEDPDYEGGAYPLSILVSAAVDTAGLTPAAAKPISDVLEYVATRGQVEGTNSGNLLPGFVPLTPALAWQSSEAVVALRAITAPAPVAAPAAGTKAPPAAAAAPAAATAFIPKAVAPPAASVAAPAPAAPQPSNPPVAGARTGATEVGYPQLGLILGLAGALLAALLVPVFGRSRKAEAE
ncbi:hypothetical protein [Microbacterium sp. P04]|uniref:hypothetical protein n=1 Tax=Microbacterium sp. P04 TaxID=3366947 RepID=UPI0037469666